MFQDIMKDSWVYQEIVQESEARGEAKGEARGEAKGEARGEAKGIQSQRQAVLEIVDKRFPLLHTLALQQVTAMANLDALRILIVNISIRDNAEDVRKLLIDAPKG